MVNSFTALFGSTPYPDGVKAVVATEPVQAGDLVMRRGLVARELKPKNTIAALSDVWHNGTRAAVGSASVAWANTVATAVDTTRLANWFSHCTLTTGELMLGSISSAVGVFTRITPAGVMVATAASTASGSTLSPVLFALENGRAAVFMAYESSTITFIRTWETNNTWVQRNILASAPANTTVFFPQYWHHIGGDVLMGTIRNTVTNECHICKVKADGTGFTMSAVPFEIGAGNVGGTVLLSDNRLFVIHDYNTVTLVNTDLTYAYLKEATSALTGVLSNSVYATQNMPSRQSGTFIALGNTEVLMCLFDFANASAPYRVLRYDVTNPALTNWLIDSPPTNRPNGQCGLIDIGEGRYAFYYATGLTGAGATSARTPTIEIRSKTDHSLIRTASGANITYFGQTVGSRVITQQTIHYVAEFDTVVAVSVTGVTLPVAVAMRLPDMAFDLQTESAGNFVSGPYIQANPGNGYRCWFYTSSTAGISNLPARTRDCNSVRSPVGIALNAANRGETLYLMQDGFEKLPAGFTAVGTGTWLTTYGIAGVNFETFADGIINLKGAVYPA